MTTSQMTTRALLSYRLRALSRRLSLKTPLSWLVLVLLLGVLGLVVYASSRLALSQTSELEIRDTTFWIGAGLTLIYSYTTFEVFFRAGDARFFDALPLAPQTRFSDLFWRAVCLHLPLLLLPLGYALGHWQMGRPNVVLYVLAYQGCQFLYGLPLAVAIHLFAGKTLLNQGSQARSLLAGNTVVNEAAVLLYAPALALLANMALSIVLDLALRDGLLRQNRPLAGPAFALTLLVAFMCWREAKKMAQAELYRMLPRFREVDIAPPYREDGVRRHVPQERLVRLLPKHLAPYALRDLRQLRRRYRLDRIGVYAYPLLAYLMLSDTLHTVERAGSLFAIWVGVLLSPAFRFKGELAAQSLDATLPSQPLHERQARLAVSLLYPLGLWGLHLVICGMLLPWSELIHAAWSSLLLALGLPLIAHLLSQWTPAPRQGLVALVFKLSVAAFALTFGAIL